MSKPRYKILLQRAIDSALAAVEIYNKPTVKYREETFSILMLNAWEILLKARLIQQSKGDLKAVFVFEHLIKKNGGKSKKKIKKLNRSGNPITISFQKALSRIENDPNNRIDDQFSDNLLLLKEFRDNSIHFYNIDPKLAHKMHEVGSATLRNFVFAVRNWFNLDVESMNLMLTPLSLYSVDQVVELLDERSQPNQVRNFLELVSGIENKESTDVHQTYCATLALRVSVTRSYKGQHIPVRISKDDPTATPVNISEVDMQSQFPWDHKMLTEALRCRYTNFKENREFHQIKKSLLESKQYCYTRYLDSSKKESGQKKTYYHPGILCEFDKYYDRR